MIGSFIGAGTIVKLGTRWTFVLGGILLSVQAFAQILTYDKDESHMPYIKFALIVGSMTSGLGQALVWIA